MITVCKFVETWKHKGAVFTRFPTVSAKADVLG